MSVHVHVYVGLNFVELSHQFFETTSVDLHVLLLLDLNRGQHLDLVLVQQQIFINLIEPLVVEVAFFLHPVDFCVALVDHVSSIHHVAMRCHHSVFKRCDLT